MNRRSFLRGAAVAPVAAAAALMLPQPARPRESRVPDDYDISLTVPIGLVVPRDGKPHNFSFTIRAPAATAAAAQFVIER